MQRSANIFASLLLGPGLPCRVVKLLDKHGQVDQEGKVAWTRNWERVWKVRQTTAVAACSCVACTLLATQDRSGDYRGTGIKSVPGPTDAAAKPG